MLKAPYRVAIFASGNGSNAQAIIEYFKDHPSVRICLVLSNNANALVLERGKRANIQVAVFTREEYSEPGRVLQLLSEAHITHIVLAGFLWLIPEYLIRHFPDHIVNIHPALLPKFGGKGMYGSKVHEAVKRAGEKETGITIHLVNERYDEGKILFQGTCPIEPDYTPAEIAQCVHALEHKHYPREIERWILQR